MNEHISYFDRRDLPDNPWREFIQNVTTGSNYFRYSEWIELLEYIDSLILKKGEPQLMTPPISRRQLHPEGSRTDAALHPECPFCNCNGILFGSPDAAPSQLAVIGLHAEPVADVVLVPREPTQRMLDEAVLECSSDRHSKQEALLKAIYQRMLAAAPQPPSAPSQSGEVAQPVWWMMDLAKEMKANAEDHPNDYISKFVLIWADQLAARSVTEPPPEIAQLQGELARLRGDSTAWDGETWIDGICGNYNIVTYNGEDVKPVAIVANDSERTAVIRRHNMALERLRGQLAALQAKSP